MNKHRASNSFTHHEIEVACAIFKSVMNGGDTRVVLSRREGLKLYQKFRRMQGMVVPLPKVVEPVVRASMGGTRTGVA